MKGRGLIVSVLFIYLFITPGCNQKEMCLSNQNAIQTGFYSAFYSTDKDSSLINTTVYCSGNEELLIYEDETVNKMFLPLSFEGDESVFVISNNSLNDTIWIVHSKELKFISRECGFNFDFKVDTVMFTKTFIDSVALFYPNVVYGENIENVKIYLY